MRVNYGFWTITLCKWHRAGKGKTKMHIITNTGSSTTNKVATTREMSQYWLGGTHTDYLIETGWKQYRLVAQLDKTTVAIASEVKQPPRSSELNSSTSRTIRSIPILPLIRVYGLRGQRPWPRGRGRPNDGYGYGVQLGVAECGIIISSIGVGVGFNGFNVKCTCYLMKYDSKIEVWGCGLWQKQVSYLVFVA